MQSKLVNLLDVFLFKIVKHLDISSQIYFALSAHCRRIKLYGGHSRPMHGAQTQSDHY